MTMSREEVCGNCGTAEIDEIKLKKCGGCGLIRYCSAGCQREHRPKHKKECKIWVAKLRDDSLFKQPDGSHRGECPICFLPMPLGPQKQGFWPCCSKLICDGCSYNHYIKHGDDNCPFCRKPRVDDEENDKRMMERIKANDPAALRQMGKERLHFEGDYDTAFEYLTKAAELGDMDAHYDLSVMYHDGSIEKDKKRRLYHLEEAAIGGHHMARHNLGCIEGKKGNTERAVKHFIIAANLGFEKSMTVLSEFWFKRGYITKENLDATLRTHKAAVGEMKSPERGEAETWYSRASIGRRN